MSFVQGVDYISDTEEVKRLARNVIPQDFSPEQIQSYQQKEYSYIRTYTNKDDWEPADREFGSLQLVETNLAAADILQHYGNVEDWQKGQAMKDSAYARLESIEENTDTAEEPSEVDAEIDRTDFKSWNKNPAVPPPNAMQTTPDIEGF